MRRAFLLLLLIVQAFVPCGTTMPSADFCCTVKMDYSILSPDSGTCSRPPAIRLTAFNAQPPNLPPAPLMVWTSRPFARSSDAVGLISGSCPSARVFAPRFLQTSPHDDALALRYHCSPSGCEEDLHLQAVNHARRTHGKGHGSAVAFGVRSFRPNPALGSTPHGTNGTLFPCSQSIRRIV